MLRYAFARKMVYDKGEVSVSMVLDLTREIIQVRSAVLGDALISYLEVGVGQNVLLIPGWLLSPKVYTQSARKLAALGFRVVIPEVYSSGVVVDSVSGLNSVTKLLEAFVDAIFGNDKYLVVGHSLGGALSLSLSAANQERIEKLVLINSIGDPSWIDHNGTASTLSKRSLNDWAGAFLIDLNRMRNRHVFLPQAALEAAKELARNPARVVKFALWAKSADMTTEIEQLSRSKIQILALWTNEDVVVPNESFIGLATGLGATIIELNGSHGWIYSSPDEFSRVVGNFLLLK